MIREIAHEENRVALDARRFFLVFLATPETPRRAPGSWTGVNAPLSPSASPPPRQSHEQIDEIKAQIAEDAAVVTVSLRRSADTNCLQTIAILATPKVAKLAGGAAVLGDAFPLYIGSVIVGP